MSRLFSVLLARCNWFLSRGGGGGGGCFRTPDPPPGYGPDVCTYYKYSGCTEHILSICVVYSLKMEKLPLYLIYPIVEVW